MIKLNEKARKDLWNEISNIEFRIRELKGVFANPIPVTQEVIDQFINEKEVIIELLTNVQDKFEIQVKSEELYQSLLNNLKNKY